MPDRRRRRDVIGTDSSCRCGKWGYWERQVAKRMVRKIRNDGDSRDPDNLHTYPCPEGTGLWHVGHRNRHKIGHNLNDPQVRFAD